MCEYFCLGLIRTNVAVDGHIQQAKAPKGHNFTGFLCQHFEWKEDENINSMFPYVLQFVYKNRQACASETFKKIHFQLAMYTYNKLICRERNDNAWHYFLFS